MTSFGRSPDAWKQDTFHYDTGLILETVKIMFVAGEEEAIKQEVPMSMAVCDAGGNLLAFHRMYNAMLASIQISIDKAYTSVFGKQPTGNFSFPYKTGELIPLFFHN